MINLRSRNIQNTAGVVTPKEPYRLQYWIDHVCEFNENHGIHRVSRGLARSLEEMGHRLAYRRWSERHRRPASCTRKELRKFARWNGPRLNVHSAPLGPAWFLDFAHPSRPGEWIIVPEVTYSRTTKAGGYEMRDLDLAAQLIEYAHSRGLKIAFIFHDHLPLETPGDPLRKVHDQYARSLANADLIVPVSKHVTRTLTDHFTDSLGLSQSRLPSIATCLLPEEYIGCDRVTEASEIGGHSIEILCVGNVSARKNQIRLLQAFEAFCREHPEVDVCLRLVGRFYEPHCQEVVHAVARNPRVTMMGFLPDEEVFLRYRQAHFSVFPSIAEGYGLPIVESLWLGKPCLCANFGSMAEVGAGGGCLTVDTKSVLELKEALTRLILDRQLRARLAREAVTRPMRSWRNYAESIVAALTQSEFVSSA